MPRTRPPARRVAEPTIVDRIEQAPSVLARLVCCGGARPRYAASLAVALLAGCYHGVPAGGGDEASTTEAPGPSEAGSDDAGESSSAGAADDDGSSSGGEPAEPEPVYPTRRLTNRELDTILRDAFDLGPEFNPYFLPLKPDEPLQVFSNEVAGLVVGSGVLEAHLEAIERFSTRIAFQGSTAPASLVDCEGLTDRACFEAFVDEIGGQLFRRPVSLDQRERLLAVYDGVLAESDEHSAYAGLVMAMILSPQTLYLLPETEERRPWAVAERLSLFLWGAGPDGELRDRAADGSILDPQVLHEQAQRLLVDQRARDNLGLFYLELLDLTRFPFFFKGFEYQDDVGLSRPVMLEDFVDAAFAPYSGGGTLEALLTDPLVFSDPAMAAYYEGEHPGLLSHPVFTWTHAGLRSTHPVERGVAIRERLLCTDLGAPPMDISAIPDVVDEDATMRERLAVHREDPACEGCHNLIDPLGLPFEGYDWVGRARALENGAPVDVSGAVTGIGDEVEVDGVFELGLTLAQTDAVRRCVAEQTLRFALLRPLDDADEPLLDEIFTAFEGADDRLDALVLAVATSDAIVQPPRDP